MNIQVHGLSASQRPILARIRNVGVNVADFKLFLNVANLKVSLEDKIGTGGNVDGTTTITTGVWNTYRIEPVAGTDQWKLLLNGVQEALVSVGQALSNWDNFRIGPMGGAIPGATADYRYDSIEVDDGTRESPGIHTARIIRSSALSLGVW
jgi:hypothetical protein